MRRTILFACLTIILRLPVGGTEADTSRPNILCLVADDLGWNDVGYHGSRIDTPHLDRLVREGVELDRHYVYPMCTPTRVALLTGRYPSRFGNRAPSNQRVLPWRAETLARALQTVGYETFLAGKWHLGSRPEWSPNHFGFDESYGSLAGGCGYFRHLYKPGLFRVTWHHNGTLREEEGHTTDLLERRVVGWIEEAAAKESPWFIYVPFTAVHTPIQPKEEWVRRYEDRFQERAERLYPALTTHLDDAIGNITAAVKRTGQAADTLVLFLSDNGAIPSARPHQGYPGPRETAVCGSNAPLRAGKASCYEGGIRTPAFVLWPGKLSPRKLGVPVHVTDWMPTLTRLAGYAPREDLHWDGQDIWPLLTGEAATAPPRTMYWRFTRGRFALRHGDLKLLDNGEGRELYDVTHDPSEEKNLLETLPPQVTTLVLDDLESRLQAERRHDSSARPPDRKVVYKTWRDFALRLHVFEPAGLAPDQPGFVPRPAIVFFFGGGWKSGHPRQFYPHCAHYADRGLVAVAAEYRIHSVHGTPPYACVEDGKSAMRWIRQRAGELGIDPQRVAAGGGSAGGHVAAATALLAGFDAPGEETTTSARPDALVLFNPVLDNRPNGYGYERIRERLQEFSPILNVAPGAPPTIIFLGTQDPLFTVESAREYQERMQKVGARCDLELYDGEKHGFFNYREGTNPFYRKTVTSADAFLESLSFLKPQIANRDS